MRFSFISLFIMIGSSWVDKDPEWKLFMKAMQEQMSQLMNSHKVVQKQIGRMKQRQNITATTNQITHRQVHRGRWHDDNDESIYESFQGCRKRDDNLGSVKMKIPIFSWKKWSRNISSMGKEIRVFVWFSLLL